MKTAIFAAIAATVLMAAPGYAATGTATPAQPLPGDDGACPVMTVSPALSETAQGLFAVIANACKLHKAGLIEDYQFQMIRDQAVNDLLAEMQAQADSRQARALAVVP